MSGDFVVTVDWTELVSGEPADRPLRSSENRWLSRDTASASEQSAVSPGSVSGPALVLGEPLSFWGGFDPATGVIIDRNHPEYGATTTDTVLFLPSGRGSSSASSVIAEAVRLDTAPRALVLAELDEIIVLGAFVANELYDRTLPVGLLARPVFDRIQTGMTIHISATTLTASPTQ